jgi:hypothetical protein
MLAEGSPANAWNEEDANVEFVVVDAPALQQPE